MSSTSNDFIENPSCKFPDNPSTTEGQSDLMSSNSNYVFENPYCEFSGDDNIDVQVLGVLPLKSMWQPSDVITVKFLNGTNADRNEVKEHAVKWTGSGAANLTLKFVSDYEDALVRVKFDTGSSDTVLGTACKGITDQSEPTIELSIPSNAPSEDRPYFILHEFGHVLGFIHEHQSPNANIPWNRDNVYAYYADRGRTQQWAEHDILNVVPAMDVAATREYDPKSIMLYRIQEDWVTDPSYAAPQVNKALSEKDKWFAARCYPH